MQPRTIITLAAGAIALGLMLPVQPAAALTAPGMVGAADMEAPGLVQDVRRVCRTYWHRGRLRTRCYWVPDRSYRRSWRRGYRGYRRW